MPAERDRDSATFLGRHREHAAEEPGPDQGGVVVQRVHPSSDLGEEVERCRIAIPGRRGVAVRELERLHARRLEPGLPGLAPDGLERLARRPFAQKTGERAHDQHVTPAEERQVAAAVVRRERAVGLLVGERDRVTTKAVASDQFDVLREPVRPQPDAVETGHRLRIVPAEAREELVVRREDAAVAQARDWRA